MPEILPGNLTVLNVKRTIASQRPVNDLIRFELVAFKGECS